MDIDDYVVVINEADQFYGKKFLIRAVQTDFHGRITGYTVSGRDGKWRDYPVPDLQYSAPYRQKFTRQMQLL